MVMKDEKTENLRGEIDDTVDIPTRRLATDYLNNERTFLAWIRTSIAVVSLGFVITKFGFFFSELTSRMEPQVNGFNPGASVPVGILMMLLGGLLAALAAWRYTIFNRQISSGEVRVDRGLIVFVTFLVVALPIVMAAFLLVSPQ
jgi:putative membrane protein